MPTLSNYYYNVTTIDSSSNETNDKKYSGAFDKENWAYHRNFNKGMPFLKNIYWIGTVIETDDTVIKQQFADFGYSEIV